MPHVTKEILRRMLLEQQQQKGMGQGQDPQQGGQGQPQVDPKMDMVAKKMALLKGSPEEKYMIFIHLLPQLLEEFGGGATKEAQAGQEGNLDVSQSNLGPAMPPPVR